MNRYIIILFLIISSLFSKSIDNFTLLNSDQNNIKFNFEIDDIELENKSNYTKINSEAKGELSIIGMPKLPEYSASFIVNPTKQYEINYNVIKSYTLENIDVIPNQNIVNGLEDNNITSKDLNLYNSSNIYPPINVNLSSPVIMRDIVVVNVSIVPFKYNPLLKELEVFEEIEIVISEVSDIEDIRRRDLPKSRVFEKIYQNNILNYESSLRDGEYQTPSILYICAGSLESNSVFQQLVQWRKHRGYKVYTASLSETGSSASSIKNYIENAYDNYDPVPEYVALVGDVGGSYSIPTYYEDFGHDSYGNDCEGDHPYTQLDGNDLLPELLIGRMSVRSTSELSAAVYKILNYEKATYLSSSDDYYERAAMAGDPSTSGNSCAITKQAIKGLLENHGFDDVSIKTSGSGWSTWMQNELSDGVLFFNYRGYLGMSGFSTSDVDNANNGYKLPFATVLTCGTGSFAEDQTSMSEKFFRAGTATNPKGGVAAIGTATWNTHTLFNNIVDMGIYHGLLADEVGTAGAALASGKFALYSAYPGNPYEWISSFTHWNNLMGDPATHLWTDTPEIITVEHPEIVPFGTNYLDVYVYDSNNNPVESALVTIMFESNPHNPDALGNNYYTDSSGHIRVEINDSVSGNIPITVTKANIKPYEGNIFIDEEQLTVNIDSESNLSIEGFPIAGNSINLSIPLKNFSSFQANNVTATLSSVSNNVFIDDTVVNYGSISPGQTVYGDSFGLTISSNVFQDQNLEILLTITDGQGNVWTSYVPLSVTGSLLLVNDTGYLNSTGEGSFDINLINAGSLNATDVTATLISTVSQVEIIDSEASWGNINSGQSSTSTNDFTVSISSDVINGTQFPLELHVQTGSGYNKIETFNLTVGNVTVNDPMGPDQYGYYIYDSNDTDYDLAPIYDWIEIDPSYGGNGTDLNLSNNGDGNWSGNGPLADIDLPFTFKFYGQEYNEITVCTNGWIALGGSDAQSFRNYPIPGAGGPSPMIAAFWDDLETSNSGDVISLITNDYVIIEWSDMRTNNQNSLETFQVILYNNTSEPYGDNNIKIQYKEFNNTSSGSYGSYPPMHGGYATIGIENHLANDGLQYSFHNQYPVAAMNLSDNTAIYITTQSPITLPAPELSFSQNSFEFNLESNSNDNSILSLSNSGEEGSQLEYSVSKSYPEVASPFDNTGGGPDASGYFWSDSDLSEEINSSWIDLTEDMVQVSFPTNDAGSELINIGFDFPFYGNNYAELIVNPNGWIGFSSDNQEWYNGNIPSVDAPTAAIFGFWDDLNPINDNCNETCSGYVYYENTEEYFVVWFNDVMHWASGDYVDSYYDFQIVIYPSGEININISDIVGNYSATVGLQNETGLIASQVDVYNGTYFHDNMSIEFLKPYIPEDWLSLESIGGLSGNLNFNESVEISLNVNTQDLPIDEYLASVIISVFNQPDIDIPVFLTVTDIEILLGDMNNDATLNISDVVILVSTIINSLDYNIYGDMNNDNYLDVIDIVILVNLILNG